MKTGIIAALDGKTIKDPLAYDSRNKHLLINPAKIPKHMDIVELPRATNFSFNTTGGGTVDEYLLKIPHGLKFIPRVACFFYARDTPPSFSSIRGLYGSLILVSPGTPLYDAIFYGADETYFYVKHRVTVDNNGAGVTVTSVANGFLLRTKYMIFSNEAVQEPYEMTYTPF